MYVAIQKAKLTNKNEKVKKPILVLLTIRITPKGIKDQTMKKTTSRQGKYENERKRGKEDERSKEN